ncbi:MAG: UDP-N-acetylglucosamine 1-carboxyvinyltransferase [Actinobacteria bacterium]|nr:UDP-N-acetylglucosamine 1-carboxyvinyltransferase [Actinomycetota bacterium]
MEKDIIRVVGGKELKGSVEISQAKNSVLKLMAASLLADDEVFIEKPPFIYDVNLMIELLKSLGATISTEGNGLKIIPQVNNFEADYELVSKMRASILVLGPLVAKYGRAKVALPGGCNIGHRKIDLHLEGLKALGASVDYESGYIVAKADRLKGSYIHLPIPSVGATENLLMAACLAEGKTVIENAAREPEIVDLANFLNKMGARINGAGSSRIEIEGVKKLKGTSHLPIPDRIEAGTFIAAALITGSELLIKNVVPEHLAYVLKKLEEAGARLEVEKNSIRVHRTERLRGIDVATFPYPGFPTDLQPLVMSVLCFAEGISVITENIFDNRFLHADELVRMGAKIEINGKHAIIHGVSKLYGVPIRAMDLRGGASLVIAALGAEGETIVYDAYHIFRGYENFIEKLKVIGANVEREVS